MTTRDTHYPRRPFSPRTRLTPEAVQELLARAYVEEQKTRAYAEAELAKQSRQFAAAIASREELAASNMEVDHALEFLVGRVASTTSASGAAIALDQGGHVACAASYGLAPPLGTPVHSANRFSGACLRTGEVLCCEDTREDRDVDPTSCDPIRSILVAPIRRNGKVVGIIAVYSCLVATFGPTESRTVQLFAGFVAEVARSDGRESFETIPLQSDVSAAAVKDERFPAEPDRLIPDRQDLPSDAVIAILPQQRRSAVIGLVVLAALIGALLVLLPGRSGRSSVSHPNAPPLSEPLLFPEPQEPAASNEISAVQFHSRVELTTISINLSAPISLAAHRLDHPNRIYLDLPAAVIPADVPNEVNIDDARVSRIRIGKNVQGPTRVVIDLKQYCEYTAAVSSTPPFKLVFAVSANVDAAAPEPRRTSLDAAPPTIVRGANMPRLRETPAMSGLRILIDPGHGGSDLGAMGQNGLREKDLVLDIAGRLGRLIRDRMSAQVIYTREADTFVPLQARASLANSTNADLFISIHGNSSDSRGVNGVETFYGEGTFTSGSRTSNNRRDPGEDRVVETSRKFALALQAELYKSVTASGRGIRNRGIKSRELAVLDASSIPAVLTEISFLTNPAEEKKLINPQYRDRIAEALCRGVAKFVSSPAFRHNNVQAAGPFRHDLSTRARGT